jgi:hypothetical protein
MTCIYHLSNSIKRTYELLLAYLGERASGKEILSKRRVANISSTSISSHFISHAVTEKPKKKKKISQEKSLNVRFHPLYTSLRTQFETQFMPKRALAPGSLAT